ncbi:MAG: hypothetical protein EHM59_00985 [Betaproteobacteria bacterium]|nr:MAG: hypothetical protein EHM59_00985 [Betaproteobacteria bacterium]
MIMNQGTPASDSAGITRELARGKFTDEMLAKMRAGRIDGDGHLWITGRCKDLIIRGGENISPAAVEQALVTIPGVTEAVVFGVPHAELGEEVMAVVVVSADLTEQQLEACLRTKVASFAVPTRWRIQKEPLPVNQTGKVDKAALMSEARAERVS